VGWETTARIERIQEEGPHLKWYNPSKRGEKSGEVVEPEKKKGGAGLREW
jgi:hypothetical protein